MSLLSNATKGKEIVPILAIIYGQDSVGKSTFASEAPNPYFLDIEKGTSEINTTRVHTKTFLEVMGYLDALTKETHDYKTLVIDSLDWLEPLIWKHLCEQHRAGSIDEVAGGYGKGYTYALNEWAKFRDAVMLLQEKKKMHVIMIAHSQIKAFRDPSTGFDYDRNIIKLNDKAAAMLREFVRAVLFATFDTVVTKNAGEKKAVAFGGTQRVIFTQMMPAYDAKNRYGLKEKIVLNWEYFQKCINGEINDTRTVVEICDSILQTMSKAEADVQERVKVAVDKAGQDKKQLLSIEEHLKGIVNG